MPLSAYIHIPFCKKKCFYCSFTSYECPDYIDFYIGVLLKEIKYFYKNETLKTLYIGGGTPSLLKIEDIQKILGCFVLTENTEITIEANPDSVDKKYLSELIHSGVNRLSLGVQSFDDKILKNIGRIHNAERAKEAVENARNAGFKNISLDFIYGLPNQTLKIFQNTIKEALRLNPEHISLYGLKIEDGSIFAKKKPANLADEDLQADMFVYVTNLIKEFGYQHYEFSNFSRKGFESRHNLNYWNNAEYYGFGTAAHGYVNGSRYENAANLEDYIKNPLSKLSEHKLSKDEQLEEEIFLGFRRCCGINKNEINEKYSIDFDSKYKVTIKKFLDSGHLIKTNTGYKLSIEGILLSNIILCDFI